MKRILKWVGIVLGVLVLCVVGFLAYVNFSGMPKFDAHVPTITVESTPARLVRGKTLVLTLCAECHRNPITKKLTGYQMLDLPEEFGTAYSKNITKHPTKGIGGWSDGEIIWLLRTGIHPKTGLYVPPWMVKLPNAADEDLYSIVAFLRSDDPLVAAEDVDNIPPKPSFLAKFLVTVGAFKPYPYPTKTIAMPDTTNRVEHGRYLANGVLACYACHSGDFKTMNELEPEKSGDFYAGGNQTMNAARVLVPTPNLTPDKETGIGNWTEEEFVQTMKTGFKKDGRSLSAPMGAYWHLSDYELGSIYQYIKTVPAIKKPRIPATEVALSANATNGEKLYNKYGCVSCHATTGLGYGDLQLADKKYPNDSLLADVILHPRTYYPLTTMREWAGHIPDNDLKEIVAHVRTLSKKSGR